MYLSNQKEHENEKLRSEVATLASSLNNLKGLRLIRIYFRYRLIRYQLENKFQMAFLKKASLPESKTEFPKNSYGKPFDIVLFSGANWGFRFQRPQQLARQWADHGYRVFYISPDFSLQVNPAYHKVPRPYNPQTVHPNIIELHLAGPREQNFLSQRMFEEDQESLFQACRTLKHDFEIEQAACILEFPFWTPLALQLRQVFDWKVVYDFMDRYYGVFQDAYAVLGEEPSLLKQADLVVASAKLLVEDAQSYNRNVVHIANGADVEHFMHPGFANPIQELGIRFPVIGYFGALNNWFDFELVIQTAKVHRDWNFVIIGSGTANQQGLRNLPNIHLLGEIPYQTLPGYVAGFNVCIIPFRSLPVTAATDPVKLYEYLAAGKPVVASGLPELQNLPVVSLVRNPEEFASGIAHALAEDKPALKKLRTSFALENSWEKRFLQYEPAVQRLFDPGNFSHANTKDNHVSEAQSPYLAEITPSAVRIGRAAKEPHQTIRPLFLKGAGFSPTCTVLLDEQPLQTQYISESELQSQLPTEATRLPGCRMISVIDESNWHQSNRRVILVDRI